MTAGLIYSCKWRNTWSGYGKRTYCGWDMLMFLRTETFICSVGVVVTNYRFHDIMTGETRLLDESLIKYCKELDLEEV